MAFWNVDLTTQDGTESAVQMGAFACFVSAALTLLASALVALLQHNSPVRSATIAGDGLQLIIFIIAGFRFRSGKGLIWGIVAAVILAIEAVANLVALTGFTGTIIDLMLLVIIINGVRGAHAGRHQIFKSDKVEDIFG